MGNKGTKRNQQLTIQYIKVAKSEEKEQKAL